MGGEESKRILLAQFGRRGLREGGREGRDVPSDGWAARSWRKETLPVYSIRSDQMQEREGAGPKFSNRQCLPGINGKVKALVHRKGEETIRLRRPSSTRLPHGRGLPPFRQQTKGAGRQTAEGTRGSDVRLSSLRSGVTRKPPASSLPGACRQRGNLGNLSISQHTREKESGPGRVLVMSARQSEGRRG